MCISFGQVSIVLENSVFGMVCLRYGTMVRCRGCILCLNLPGGMCDRQGTSGGHPGFPIEIWILGYNGYCVLVARKLCPAAVTLPLCLCLIT